MLSTPLPSLAFLGTISYWEVILFALVGLLIFGKRLPEVGRSVGRGIVEFKRGLSGIDDDLQTSSSSPPPRIEPARQDDLKTDAPQATHAEQPKANASSGSS
ncbi:MAG: twin-arginine translocase TatA/TatE family subunit [Phycisphaeraceae bacterium]